MDHFGFAAAFSVEGFVELSAQGADVFGGAAEDVAVAGGVGSYEDAGDAGAAFGEAAFWWMRDFFSFRIWPVRS